MDLVEELNKTIYEELHIIKFNKESRKQLRLKLSDIWSEEIERLIEESDRKIKSAISSLKSAQGQLRRLSSKISVSKNKPVGIYCR